MNDSWHYHRDVESQMFVIEWEDGVRGVVGDVYTSAYAKEVCDLHNAAIEVRVPEPLTDGDIRLDFASRKLFRGDEAQHLTFTEFKLLAWFMEHPGQSFTRPQLIHAVWQYAVAAGARTVDVHVARLRQKIGAERITVQRGHGYRFEGSA